MVGDAFGRRLQRSWSYKPAVGVLRREFRGEVHEVWVLTEGFEYWGERFASLSTLATKIAGSRWNGFLFFKVGAKGAA